MQKNNDYWPDYSAENTEKLKECYEIDWTKVCVTLQFITILILIFK